MKRQKGLLEKQNPAENPGNSLNNRSFAEQVKNEDGFVLILSMMVLVVLTLLGMSATKNALIETQIAGNDNVAKILFYDAESAAFETAQRLENEKEHDALKADRPSEEKLVINRSVEDILLTTLTADEVEQLQAWQDNSQQAVLTQENITTDMVALDYGPVKGSLGSSLKMTESKVYFFKLIGRAVLNNVVLGVQRDKMIEIGYRKRY